MFEDLYTSPAMQVSIWSAVIIAHAELMASKFFIQNPNSVGKLTKLTKLLLKGHKFEGNFVAFDKIGGQMLNSFTAFSIFFFNFHVALFSLINDLFSLISQLKYYY